MGLGVGSIAIANSDGWVKVSDRPWTRQVRASAGAKRGWHKGGTPRHMDGVVVARLPCDHGVPGAWQGVPCACLWRAEACQRPFGPQSQKVKFSLQGLRWDSDSMQYYYYFYYYHFYTTVLWHHWQWVICRQCVWYPINRQLVYLIRSHRRQTN